MEQPLRDTISAKASEVAFGSPIIQNNLRAIVVEAIVDCALKPSWRWCSQDWSGWDFEHESGIRLELKQSAARQTWIALKCRQVPRFDIRERTGYWENGVTWIAQPGRCAQIYLFAHHPIADESADHVIHCNGTSMSSGRPSCPRHEASGFRLCRSFHKSAIGTRSSRPSNESASCSKQTMPLPKAQSHRDAHRAR